MSSRIRPSVWVRRRALAAVFVSVLVWLCLPSAVRVAGAAQPQVGWSKCYADYGNLECGLVQVPLDYDEPHGPKISIALVRQRATDPARRIGSLFLNPGGPGVSGVDLVRLRGATIYTPEVRARFDLVGFDPRGVMRSSPLRCFGSLAQIARRDTPWYFPSTPAEEERWIALDRYMVVECEKRDSRVAQHMSTANAARDLDQLRQAVGDDGLTYAGYSYGSFLGVTYANLFPDKVRALIVDGVLDPIAWSTGHGDDALTVPVSLRLPADRGTQTALEEFFRLCDAGGPRCALAPNAADRFAALVTRLRDDHLAGRDAGVSPDPYTGLIAVASSVMYNSYTWEQFAQFVAGLEAQVDPEQIKAKITAFREELEFSERGAPQPWTGWFASKGVACSETDNPDSYAAWSAAGAASAGYFGRIWTWQWSLCAEWPFRDADRYSGPFDRPTANPLLVIGNTFDPVTPLSGAQVVASLMPNAALLTVNAWGHISVRFSQCAIDTSARYLTDLTLPPPGSVCEQDRVPFSEG